MRKHKLLEHINRVMHKLPDDAETRDFKEMIEMEIHGYHFSKDSAIRAVKELPKGEYWNYEEFSSVCPEHTADMYYLAHLAHEIFYDTSMPPERYIETAKHMHAYHNEISKKMHILLRKEEYDD